MIVLTVTGGIGSGKSEVCRIIHDAYGFPVYEADKKVKELYRKDISLLEGIENELKCSLRDEQGCFMPGSLAERIFGDHDAMNKVESLVFPALVEDFNSWKQDHADKDAVVFESATVLEKDFFNGFSDKVIIVDAPFDTRLKRACARDKASEQDILRRMMAQKLMNSVSEGYGDLGVDAVIRNEKDFASLESEVKAVINGILTSKHN
ncbi:MAG: dephospho-CoA kinase [Bacteroidales bacterium]|nr:dephospho-CoA kinase [Bacteroidales bacterium]